MKQPRPGTKTILKGLKDFQLDTVEYVFRRLYLDDDNTRRFLVADEVGLGKTLVARGVIAKTIDYLWDRTDRIDVVYVCSNTDIARQNIQRLNVTGCEDFSLSSRITLLPITVGDMQHRRINFVSFTPGTSFDLKGSSGTSRERELLFWLLKEPWSLTFKKATRVLHAYAGIDAFRKRVERFPENHDIHQKIAKKFAQNLLAQADLKEEWDATCDMIPRAGYKVPKEIDHQRNKLIGKLRRLLAETCLHWLEPDLIILDEFQRFKHLLQGDTEESSEAAQLAEHLFSFQQSAGNKDTAARVLLLSATPYKMYTQSHESEEDDHYQDFQTTLDFLLHDESKQEAFHHLLSEYRDELFRLAEDGTENLERVKTHLELALRNVMVRTEKLALKADRNGMLVEMPSTDVTLKPDDVSQYLGLQQVAKHLGHADIIEYWKSSPYLLNFMEEYDLKKKLKKAVEGAPDSVLAKRMRSVGTGLLNPEEIERYRRLDPANARLRALHADTVARDAWKLLWIPPSMPYYEGTGPYADPKLKDFTKRLVFSSWKVVPKAVSSVLSYEAERCMIQSFRRKARNSAETRKRMRGLLRFSFSKGRAAGLPVLGILYPCQYLAQNYDPVRLCRASNEAGELQSARQLLSHISRELSPELQRLFSKYGSIDESIDERWYSVAPILLDLDYDPYETEHWIEQTDLAAKWRGSFQGDSESGDGWTRHVRIVKRIISGEEQLGRQPDDLATVISHLAVAGPGVVALRALQRILPKHKKKTDPNVRDFAGPLAHSFLHLFNLPEVMYLLRDRRKNSPYWQTVLQYCVAGNLQSVIDEYAHVLVESLGLLDSSFTEIASEVSKAISDVLTLRTSTAKADIIAANRLRVIMEEEDAIRMRTRFAMRFGDQVAEDSTEPTRADSVRSAFNSPFWPFVLSTTSVGQEGLDFHPYCHAVVHWNLPSNPVDLEQREGRVHRYKGHALRKNIASLYSSVTGNGESDPWAAMFSSARMDRPETENDLYPFWIAPDGEAKIERHVPALPHSREIIKKANLSRSLVLYRMVFGQNRQDDLVEYLASHLPPENIDDVVEMCRIDLAPKST